ncbi:MAG: FAD-binding oxidoreductase, partial [Pseudomonadota bacterium]|nr:FAD-binding oxidoreductase [Pseudomonadota bacterium]
MTALRPERLSAVTAALRQPGVGTGTIAYGDGRNYGDLAMCQNGRIVLTRRLNRILSFEKDTGLVSVEPGVTFRELHSFASEHGFLVPVVPGTAFVTLGGGVASDIHGKNQDTQGCLGDHIEWLDLVVASGDVIRVSRSEHPKLFSATIGGCGLTGVISAIGLRLQQLKANAVSVEEWRVKDLDSFFDLMYRHRSSSTYTVGWVDALQKGRSLGRGIFQAAEPVFSDGFSPRTSNRKIPFTCPDATLNRASVQAFNSIYYRRVPKNGRSRIVGYEEFHHP